MLDFSLIARSAGSPAAAAGRAPSGPGSSPAAGDPFGAALASFEAAVDDAGGFQNDAWLMGEPPASAASSHAAGFDDGLPAEDDDAGSEALFFLTGMVSDVALERALVDLVDVESDAHAVEAVASDGQKDAAPTSGPAASSLHIGTLESGPMADAFAGSSSMPTRTDLSETSPAVPSVSSTTSSAAEPVSARSAAPAADSDAALPASTPSESSPSFISQSAQSKPTANALDTTRAGKSDSSTSTSTTSISISTDTPPARAAAPTAPIDPAPVQTQSPSPTTPGPEPAPVASRDVSSGSSVVEVEDVAASDAPPVVQRPARPSAAAVRMAERVRAAVEAVTRSNVAPTQQSAPIAPSSVSETPAVTPVPVEKSASSFDGPVAGQASPSVSSLAADVMARSSSDEGETTNGGYGHLAAPRTTGPVTVSSPVNFAAMAQATADTLPTDTAAQIVQAMRVQLARDGGEAHIRLDPRQFGDVTIRVRVEQGQVVARVEADVPVVREWLQSNQHVLRQSLAGQQLTLDRLDVREPAESSDAEQSQDSPRRRDPRDDEQPRRRRPDTGELFDIVA